MNNKQIQKVMIKSGLSAWKISNETGVSHFAIWSFINGQFNKVSKKNIAILGQWAMNKRGKTIWDRIKEFCKGVLFCLFFVSLFGLASIFDGFDQTIIESRGK